MESLKVLSIDIGIVNLGYVYANINWDSFTNSLKLSKCYLNESFPIEVIKCDRINITNIKHSVIPFCDCKLHHDYCIPDYLDHFIQEHSDLFEQSDVVLLERQPPVGVTNVQDLLFTKFRHKVVLINPVSVHKYFNMSKDYSKRKQESEKIAGKYLLTFNKFYNNTRKHDISDAMLMIMYYYSLKHNEHVKQKNVVLDFEQFRFVKI